MDDIRKQLSRQEFHLMTYMWMEERPLTMKEICACMEKKTESTYNADIRAEQKYRYGDQGNDIDADELETESDPVTEDM